MKGVIAFILTILILGAPTALFAQEYIEQCTAGDAAYLKRSEDLANVKTAISKWESAQVSKPGAIEPYLKIAMAYFYLGRFAANSDEARRKFEKGNDYAKKALAINEKSAAAHYWWAVTLAKSVEQEGKFAKLTILADVTKSLHIARKIDPTYFFGGPDRALGMISIKNPVPSYTLAIHHLTQSLTYAPDYSRTLLFLGEAYAKDNQRDKARNILKKVLETKPMPGFKREEDADKKMAEQLLSELGK